MRSVRLPIVFSLVLGVVVSSSATRDAAWLVQNGRADEALGVLNPQIQHHPNDARAYNLISRVNFQLEHWDDAIRAAEKSAALAPDDSEYHQWLARAYGRKAEAAGAMAAMSLVRKVKAEFERAVELDPAGKNLSARADLAEFYIDAPYIMGGDKAKAKRLAESIAGQDSALANYILALVEEKQNAREHAERQYRAAIQASADPARYWVALASFYKRVDRLDDMEWAITKSLSVQRTESIPLFDGAALLLMAGRNFPGAINMFRQYLSLDDPAEDGPAFQAHYLLGVLLEKQGDQKAAAAEYRAALTLASEYYPAQEGLARVSR